MKIKRITKHFGRKISWDYHVWTFETEIEAEIDETESEGMVSKELFEMCKTKVKEDIEVLQHENSIFKLALQDLNTQYKSRLSS